MPPEIIQLRDACTGDTAFRILHESGLEIRVAEMPAFNTAYAQLGTKFGAIHRRILEAGSDSAYEMPAGIAHYLEHKLFEKEDGDVMRQFAALGAADNAYTDFDRTVYHFRTQQRFPEALGLLLDFVQKPYFTAESVLRERSIIAQEILEARDDPADCVFQQLMQGMYHTFPLHPDVLGTAESIAEITPEMLYRCHRLFYHPQHMVLCCAGNVRTDEILETADRYLRRETPLQAEALFLPEPETVVADRLSGSMPIGKTQFAIGFKSRPVSGTERLHDSLLASLTVDLLTGPASPLYQKMLREGLINDTFDTDCFTGDGWFTVIAEGESDDPEAVLEALLTEIQRLADQGIDENLFAVLKKGAYGDSLIGMNSPEAVCTAMLDAYIWDCESHYVRTAMLAAMTSADVQKCLRERFRSDRVCLSVMTPDSNP